MASTSPHTKGLKNNCPFWPQAKCFNLVKIFCFDSPFLTVKYSEYYCIDQSSTLFVLSTITTSCKWIFILSECMFMLFLLRLMRFLDQLQLHQLVQSLNSFQSCWKFEQCDEWRNNWSMTAKQNAVWSPTVAWLSLKNMCISVRSLRCKSFESSLLFTLTQIDSMDQSSKYTSNQH